MREDQLLTFNFLQPFGQHVFQLKPSTQQLQRRQAGGRDVRGAHPALPHRPQGPARTCLPRVVGGPAGCTWGSGRVPVPQVTVNNGAQSKAAPAQDSTGTPWEGVGPPPGELALGAPALPPPPICPPLPVSRVDTEPA